jgi:chromosome segregation ATPase
MKKYDEVRTIANAFEGEVNKTIFLRTHIEKREEKAEGDFTSLKQAKDEAYRQHEALRSKKKINEHEIQFHLEKVDELRVTNMEITEEQDSYEGMAFRNKPSDNAEKAWKDWKVQLKEAKKSEKKAKDELVPWYSRYAGIQSRYSSLTSLSLV